MSHYSFFQGLVGESERALEFVSEVVQQRFPPPPPPSQKVEGTGRRKKVPSQRERRAAQGDKREGRWGEGGSTRSGSRSSTPTPSSGSRVAPISSTPNATGGYRKKVQEDEEEIYYVKR